MFNHFCRYVRRGRYVWLRDFAVLHSLFEAMSRTRGYQLFNWCQNTKQISRISTNWCKCCRYFPTHFSFFFFYVAIVVVFVGLNCRNLVCKGILFTYFRWTFKWPKWIYSKELRWSLAFCFCLTLVTEWKILTLKYVT